MPTTGTGTKRFIRAMSVQMPDLAICWFLWYGWLYSSVLRNLVRDHRNLESLRPAKPNALQPSHTLPPPHPQIHAARSRSSSLLFCSLQTMKTGLVIQKRPVRLVYRNNRPVLSLERNPH